MGVSMGICQTCHTKESEEVSPRKTNDAALSVDAVLSPSARKTNDAALSVDAVLSPPNRPLETTAVRDVKSLSADVVPPSPEPEQLPPSPEPEQLPPSPEPEQV